MMTTSLFKMEYTWEWVSVPFGHKDKTEKPGLSGRRPAANQVTDTVAIVTHSAQVTLIYTPDKHPTVPFLDRLTQSFH